jgi:hypothetical protein
VFGISHVQREKETVARHPGRRPAEEAPPAAPEEHTDGQRQLPATEIRLGRVRVTVWENHHPERGKWFSLVPSRSYKDGNGEWKSASSFGRDDLLVLAEAARLAYHWVVKQYQGGPGHPDEEGTDTPF